MRAHFQKLYGEISMIAMDSIIEEQCFPVAATGSPERKLLDEIYAENDLDKRHLICARYLGYTEKAELLEAWIAKKKKKRFG